MTRIRGEQPQIAAVNGALCCSWRDGGGGPQPRGAAAAVEQPLQPPAVGRNTS